MFLIYLTVPSTDLVHHFFLMPQKKNQPLPYSQYLQDGGEMGQLIRSFDWSNTILGSPDGWSQSLRVTIGIILKSKFPMFLWWGTELIQFYNDAYRPSLGNNGKHPKSLGQKGEECWPETWPVIKPLIDQVMSGGKAIWQEDTLIPIYRNNKLEDVYWTFSYSLVNEEAGKAGGVLVICHETTDNVKVRKDLKLAKNELSFQNQEKQNRADELVVANNELDFQDQEKEKRAAELVIVNNELDFQDQEKEKRAAELVIANGELVFQNEEKEKRATELVIANKELVFQNQEKENRAAELLIANKELVFQNQEKENRAAELVIANKELVFQNQEKENRAAELVIANKELVFQNREKENRAAELAIANKELAFQNQEKENRAAELVIANKERVFQNREKEKRAAELVEVNNEFIHLTKALSESESMMETIPQMAWTVTVDAEANYFNQRWYDYTGLDFKKTKAHGWYQVIHPDDLQQALEKSSLILDGPIIGGGEMRYKRADGKYRWHLISMLPIKNEHGEVQLWMGTATDIQGLKELQQQKDDFISIASHELKTPMTTLTASLQLLNRMKDNPSPKIFSSLIERSNKSLDKLNILIKDLLNVGQFKEDQIHLNKTQFVISKIIDDCCTHVRAEDIYIIKTEGDMDLQVYADEGRIDQVMINFVNNAMKYAPASKEIQINIEKLNDMAKVSVTDKGAGIAPVKIPHLFDRYFRVDNNGNQYSGLGLGLYICAEIIKKHGGQIGVDSEVGRGSTFWFTLPLSPN